MSFATTDLRQPPKTLTGQEQATLLRVTGDHRDGFRDHMIFALALATALREHEIAALNMADLFDGSRPRLRVQLRVFKGQDRAGAERLVSMQEVFLPERLRYKLSKLYRWKIAEGQSIEPDAAVFASRESPRIALRTIRYVFAVWQKRAGFERRFGFHHLRHTALTNLYRQTRDIRLVQRVARHVKIETTTIYAAPSDEDVARAVRGLPC